jgi:alkylresorcinol/alkylpyrone synthase
MNTVHWLSHATGNPPRWFTQEQCLAMAGYERFGEEAARKFRALLRASAVERRALWLNEAEFRLTEDPDDFHRRYVEGVRYLAPRVARLALEKAGLGGSDVDYVVFVSCTGYACPGFSMELAHELGMSDGSATANLVGMGCSALVPGLERAWERCVARPGTRSLVVAAEVSSAMYWVDEEGETQVGNAIFGDGAAAILLSSRVSDVGLARVEGFRTVRDTRFLGDMGLTQQRGRLRLRLARELPGHILPMVEAMVERLELGPGARPVLHPGGRRILDLIEERFGPRGGRWRESVGWSRGVLRDFGNMSSPTVAFVLERALAASPARAGEELVLVAMGPGLAVEAARLRWN